MELFFCFFGLTKRRQVITGASFNKWPGKVFFEANKHVLRPLVEISSFGHLIFLLCMFRAGFISRTSAKQTLAYFSLGELGVSALSFSFFGFVLFYCCFFFSVFVYCLFRGLILAPDELRTNSERTLALSFLEFFLNSVLNFLGFGRTKTLELQLVDAFFVQI